MNSEELIKLLSYYQHQMDNANDSITDLKQKKSTETSRMYNECTQRYKEGFRDALSMVTTHLTKILDEHPQ